MNLETYARAAVARFAIQEGARYGGTNNMLAVAWVLRNRVFAGWGDWLEVAETAAAKRGAICPSYTPQLRGGNVRVFLQRLDEIYGRETAEDLTGGALFYVDPEFAIEPWFEREVLKEPEQHPRVAHVGPVWFFQ